jgi:hypothetical protein
MKEIAEAAYSSAAAEAGQAGAEASTDDGGKGDDDVIDAEFEEGN